VTFITCPLPHTDWLFSLLWFGYLPVQVGSRLVWLNYAGFHIRLPTHTVVVAHSIHLWVTHAVGRFLRCATFVGWFFTLPVRWLVTHVVGCLVVAMPIYVWLLLRVVHTFAPVTGLVMGLSLVWPRTHTVWFILRLRLVTVIYTAVGS